MIRKGLLLTTAVAATLAISSICATKVDAHTRITTDITWSGEIRDILTKKCMNCHHPGGIAPDYVDLTFYGTDVKPGARAWAVDMEEQVLTGKMPPWQADPRFSEFSNAHKLTQQEIDLIVAWVNGGGPQGPLQNLPVPPEVLKKGWSLAQPDIVVEPGKPFTLSKDTNYATSVSVTPIKIEKDTYITGYEYLPDNPKFVKSMTAWIHDPPGYEPEPVEVDVRLPYDPLADSKELDTTRMRPMPKGPHFLGTWFRGDQPRLLPDSAGRLLRAGSTVELIVEYERPDFAEPVEVTDQSKLGLFVALKDEQIDLLVESKAVENDSFTVPANDSDYKVSAELDFDEDVHLINLAPRMNRLGSKLQAQLVYPDGLAETVLLIPNFNYRWNSNYTFDTPVAAPKGSKLILTGWFNNTDDNWDNPNSPPEDVPSGEGQFDEKLMAMVDYTLDDHLYVQKTYTPKNPDDAIERKGGGMSIVPPIGVPVDKGEKKQEPLELTKLPESAAKETGGEGAKKEVPDSEIWWCPMRGTTCALVDYYEPGTCPECFMKLKPKLSFFEGKSTAPETYDWPLTTVGQEEVYWCPNRGRADHELIDYPAPGVCPIDGAKLIHKSRFVTVHTYTCLTPGCDRFKDIFYGPGLCPSCGQPVTSMGHMDHNPVHGGWQFFMADDMYHHLEGTMPEPGLFKLYLYDDWKQPLDARNFAAKLYVSHKDEASGEVTEKEYPMYVGLPGDAFLLCDLPEELPITFYVKIWLAGEEKRFDFEFDELTPKQPDKKLAVRLHKHDCPKIDIPQDTVAKVKMIRERMATLQSFIDAEDWYSLHCTAYEAKDILEALNNAPGGGLNIRQVGNLKEATALINRGALALDRAGDAADPARVRKAFGEFTQGVEKLTAIFPEAAK